jgi:hypothetical protein
VLRLRNKLEGEQAQFPGGPPHVTCIVKGNFVEDTRSELSGVNITFNENTPSADSIVRAAGSFETDGWVAGDRVAVSGSVSNDGIYTIATVAALTLTLVATDDLADEGPVGGVTLKRWAHPDNGGDNPAMCLRDYLLSTVYGPGFAESLLDETSFKTAADYCDELVTIPTGTEKRFRCNGRVDTGQSCIDNRDDLLSSCRGTLPWQGGKFYLRIRNEDATPSSYVDLTQDNIVGDWRFNSAGVDEKFNIVMAHYVDPTGDNYQPREASWPAPGETNTYLDTEDDGFENRAELELPFTQSYYTAQHIAQTTLKESRKPISAQVTCTEEALYLEVGEVVNVTHETPGWSSKDFVVLRVALAANTQIRLDLAEYDSTVYDIDTLIVKPGDPGTETEIDGVPPPTNLTLSQDTELAQLYASWTAPDYGYIDRYDVEARHMETTGGDGLWRSYAPKPNPEDDNTQAIIFGVRSGQDWQVRVRTVAHNGGTSVWVVSTTYSVDLDADISVSVTGVDAGVEIEVTDFDFATEVKVYARENAGTGGADPFETSQYYVTSLYPGDQEYLIPAANWVRVLFVPYNAYGERCTAPAIQEAQSGGGSGPSAPPNTFASPSQTYNSVSLSWVNGDATATTRIYVNGVLNQTAAAAATTATVTGLASNTSYVFVARHYLNGVENPTDNSVTITQATATGTLGTPTGLAGQTIAPVKVKLTWTQGSPGGSGAGHTVQRSSTGAFTGEEVQIGTPGPGITQFEHEDSDEAGVTWYFRIKATRTGWTDSAWTSAITKAYGPDASLTAAAACHTDLGCGAGFESHCIAWGTVYANATDHHVELWRSEDGGAYALITDDLSPVAAIPCFGCGLAWDYGHEYDCTVDETKVYRYRVRLMRGAVELDNITDIWVDICLE